MSPLRIGRYLMSQAHVLFGVLAFAMIAESAEAADLCSLKTRDVVAKSSRRVTQEEIGRLPKNVSIRDAVTALGPGMVDSGSALPVIVWEMTDGSLFSITSGKDLCAPSQTSSVVSAPKSKATNDPSQGDLPAGTRR